VNYIYWLGVERCSNQRRNLGPDWPDESGPRYAWHTYQKLAPEKRSRFMVPVVSVM